MSVANAAPVAIAAAAVEIANPIDVIANSLNTNPYFIGTMMLMLNLFYLKLVFHKMPTFLTLKFCP